MSNQSGKKSLSADKKQTTGARYERQVCSWLEHSLQLKGKPSEKFVYHRTMRQKHQLNEFLVEFEEEDWMANYRQQVEGQVDYYCDAVKLEQLHQKFTSNNMRLVSLLAQEKAERWAGTATVIFEIKETLSLLNPEQLIREAGYFRETLERTGQPLVIIVIADSGQAEFNSRCAKLREAFRKQQRDGWVRWLVSGIFACYIIFFYIMLILTASPPSPSRPCWTD